MLKLLTFMVPLGAIAILVGTAFAQVHNPPIELSNEASRILIQELRDYRAADGSLKIDVLSCRGLSIAWECYVNVNGRNSSFAYRQAYRVAQALGSEVGFITERTRSGKAGLHNSTVYGLACGPTSCQIDAIQRGPIIVGD